MSKKPKFDWKANACLVINQHKFNDAMRSLFAKNGSQPYITDPKRRTNVVRFYMKRFNLLGTSVETFWLNRGECILMGLRW